MIPEIIFWAGVAAPFWGVVFVWYRMKSVSVCVYCWGKFERPFPFVETFCSAHCFFKYKHWMECNEIIAIHTSKEYWLEEHERRGELEEIITEEEENE